MTETSAALAGGTLRGALWCLPSFPTANGAPARTLGRMASNPFYQGPVSDHFDGVRFFNPDSPTTDKSFSELLRWRMTGKRAVWDRPAPVPQAVPDARVDGLRVTMVGHATVLIQAAGQNMLVDPLWSERASPVGFAGPIRANAPGIAFAKLPKIDVVLLTHNHYDHLDMASMTRLWDEHAPVVIAPLGNDGVIGRKVPRIRVETRDWGGSVPLKDGLVHVHPANHWSGRGATDRRMALWGGFIVETSAGSIYVAGDTGYGNGRIFHEVKRRWPSLDVAILPLGAYEPRWFMKAQHVDPDEAVQIMLDTGARQALGVHWGTFALADEARLAPREALHASLARRGIDAATFRALEPGDVWTRPVP